MWAFLQERQEFFGFVVNRCKDGGHYWVFAHVTPSLDRQGSVVGYHSNRRVPDRRALERVVPLYREMKALEEQERDRRVGLDRARALLAAEAGAYENGYREWIFATLTP